MASVSGSGGVGLGAVLRKAGTLRFLPICWRRREGERGLLASKSEALMGLTGGSFLGFIGWYFWSRLKISSSKNDEKMAQYRKCAIG
jgi:hypothetical protein